MCAVVGNGVVAFACVIGTVGRDAADLLRRRDLVEQVGQHRCITDVAASNLDRANLQCLFVDPEVDLASEPSLLALLVILFQRWQ